MILSSPVSRRKLPAQITGLLSPSEVVTDLLDGTAQLVDVVMILNHMAVGAGVECGDSVLKNPIYAGAYTYGRSKTTTRLEAGQKRVFRQKKNRREDWTVLIMDHHESYIDWLRPAKLLD